MEIKSNVQGNVSNAHNLIVRGFTYMYIYTYVFKELFPIFLIDSILLIYWIGDKLILRLFVDGILKSKK